MKIYNMKKYIDIFGEIGTDVSLLSLQKQVQDIRGDTIYVRINSPGGSVTEGRAIRAYLLSLGKEITTECFGDCSSIATEIFLSGKKRIAHEGVRFLVHQPYTTFLVGTQTDLATFQSELKKIEDEMIVLYMKRDKNKKYTYEDWQKMLQKQVTFTASELLQLGFATEIKKSYQSKVFYMKNRKSIFARLQKMLGAVKALTFTQSETDYEVVTESETPQIGDAVIVIETGEPAPDGEYVFSDEVVLVVKDGLIEEVLEASGEQELEATLESFAKAISDLKAENELIKKALKLVTNADLLAFKKDKTSERTFQPSVKFKKTFKK